PPAAHRPGSGGLVREHDFRRASTGSVNEGGEQMRMRLLVCVTTILLAGAAWAQQMCPDPNSCAGCNLPKECCSGVGGLLVYECATATRPPDFVISDKESPGGSLEVDLTAAKGVPANFSVAGNTVSNLVIGNATFAPFKIGSSASSARFTTSDGGQCVAVSNLTGFVIPGPIVVANRALTLSKSNPFYCRSPAPARDIICFQVKGQVGPPFPTLACTPDRVE